MADQNDITFKDDTVPVASLNADTASSSGTVAKLKEGASHLLGEAGESMKTAATEGKEKAAAALTSLTQTVENAAQLIEEKVGPTYGGYVRKAGATVSGLAETLQNKDMDELLDDTRAFVRKSPMVAVGAAAAIGFVLTRLVKVGSDATGVPGSMNNDRTNGKSA